jgi:glutamate/aspartate transport system substrate-binding protein
MLRAAIICLVVVFSAGLASAQTPADSRMKRIADTKTIKLGHRAAATPFSFLDEKKEPTGYTVDLCKLVVEAIGKKLGVTLKTEWVPVTTQNRFEAVAQGKADMECGSSTITLSRMNQVDFSTIIFVESTGVVVKADAGIKTASDLNGKTIAVVANTSNESALVELVKQGKLNAALMAVPDREAGIAALEKGDAHAYASDKLLLVGARFSDAKALSMLPDDLSIEPYAIVLPRGDWALRLAVNSALADIYRSGQIAPVFGRWFSQLNLTPGPLLLGAFTLGALPH